MTLVQELRADIAGVSTRMLAGGDKDAPVVLFLHGGIPGVTPYCGGAHIWGKGVEGLARSRRIILADLQGAGGSDPGAGPLTLDGMVEQVTGLLAWVGRPVHLVGHDLGGLVALTTALAAPQAVSALTIVASRQTAPTGDSVDNLALLSPPQPLWSRNSQSWAYDRLSYSHHHIDNALLDGSVAAAAGAAHRLVLERRADVANARSLPASIEKAKSAFYKAAREQGVGVATQILWGSHDPLTTLDHGLVLFRVIASKQRAAQFQLINRAGSFLFREQPDEFCRLLCAFGDGVMAEAA